MNIPVSYIKNEFLKETLKRCEIDSNWILQVVCEHHNTFATVYKLTNLNNGKILALKVEEGYSPKLLNEVFFINNNKHLSYFPEIYHFGCINDNYMYYTMEYLENYQVFSELYENNELTKIKLLHLLKMVKKLNDTTDKTSSEINGEEVYKKYFVQRLENRLKLLEGSCLSKILTYDYLFINGIKYKNLKLFWENYFYSDQQIILNAMGNFPGDLHFEHIFINKYNEIKIIDPNGASKLPLIYDLGKILHSLHGCYNTFTNLNFHIDNFQDNRLKFFYTFPSSRKELLAFFENEVINIWDIQTLKGAYLSELFHFSSLLAHHTKIEIEALGLYCRTLELMKIYEERFWNKKEGNNK